MCVQERNALKRSKPQSDAPHPETPGVKGARADLTRVSAAGQIRRGQLRNRQLRRKCAGPKPLPHSLAPNRLKKHGCARSKKHAQKQQSCEFSMHMHENCSKRCAHVACLLSTRRGHSSHAMLGKASASATLTVRRRPSRQPEASARAPSGPPMPSKQLQQIHAGIAARQRRRRRTAAQQGPAPRTRSLAHPWTTQRRQKRLAPKLTRSHARHRQEACPVKLRWRPPPQHRSAEEGTPDALEAKPPPQALRELEGQPGESTTATTHKHPRYSGPPTLAPEPPATKAIPTDSQGHAVLRERREGRQAHDNAQSNSHRTAASGDAQRSTHATQQGQHQVPR